MATPVTSATPIPCFLARAMVKRLSQSCRPLRALGWCCDDAARQSQIEVLWVENGVRGCE